MPARAVRTGATVAVGLGLGDVLGVPHPSWVALTAAAVLQATDLGTTLRRALHRAAGTLLGLGLAAALLAAHPPDGVLVGILAACQLVVEATITISYVLAVAFITPLALGLLSLADPALDPHTVLEGRGVDTLLGVGLGVLVAALPLPGRARDRLPGAQGGALRAAGEVLGASLRHRPTTSCTPPSAARARRCCTCALSMRTRSETPSSAATPRTRAGR